MKLSVHHVGGRWGTIPPIEKWSAFFPIIDVTVYEPDQAAAAQIKNLGLARQHGFASVNVQTDCLGERDGTSDFYLCFDRNASSMLPFDPAYADFGFFTDSKSRGVYTLGIANQSKKMPVAVRSLGSLIAEGKITVPDVLSIDAEGVTLEILKGLGDEMLQNVTGLFLEANFLPYHRGESNLHTIMKHLDDRGFLFIDMGEIGRYSLQEMHLGAFDRGALALAGDALFLRDPKNIDAPEGLEKLALLGILCGATSVTYACFRKLETLNRIAAWNEPSADIGQQCLADFYRTYVAYKDLKLPKLNEIYTEDVLNHHQYTDAPTDAELNSRHGSHVGTTLPPYVSIFMKYKELVKTVPAHDTLYAKYKLYDLAKAANEEHRKQGKFLMNLLLDWGFIQKT